MLYSQPYNDQLQQNQWNASLNKQPNIQSGEQLDSVGNADDNLNTIVTAPSSYNQKTSERMRQDEGMINKIKK